VVHHDNQLDLFAGSDMMVMKPGDFLPRQSSIHRLHKITINVRTFIHIMHIQCIRRIVLTFQHC